MNREVAMGYSGGLRENAFKVPRMPQTADPHTGHGRAIMMAADPQVVIRPRGACALWPAAH